MVLKAFHSVYGAGPIFILLVAASISILLFQLVGACGKSEKTNIIKFGVWTCLAGGLVALVAESLSIIEIYSVSEVEGFIEVNHLCYILDRVLVFGILFFLHVVVTLLMFCRSKMGSI